MDTLRHEWWRIPFKVYRHYTCVTDFPHTVFSNTPMERRKYCMMHSININLSNSLIDCYQLLPTNSPLWTRFQNVVKTVFTKWTPKKTLEPKQSKNFFKRHLQNQLVEIFTNLHVTYSIPWPEQRYHIALPVHQLIGLLFDSQRVYYNFVYTEWPTAADFKLLNSARTGLLAVYAGMQWRMKPTMHYATNEAIEFAVLDGTMYHTLNKGPEHHHHTLKDKAHNSMQNITIAQTGVNSFQQVVNYQSLA